MIDFVLAGFLVSIPIGVITRMNRVFTWGFCAVVTTIGIIEKGGPWEYITFLWDMETLAVCGGTVVGFLLGYLAADGLALWLVSR